jgi:hypothetical protein
VSALLWLAAFALRGAECAVQAVASGIAGRPLISIVSLFLMSCSVWGLGSAARRRDWGAGLVCSLVLMAAFVWLEDQIDGRLDDCRSLKPFAEEVRKHVGGDERVLFFLRPLPAVALYAERRIPTLRDRDASPPRQPFYLIVPDSLAAEVPQQWLTNAETVASGHGRVFTRRSMGIHLLRIAPSTPPPPGSGNKGNDIPIRAVPGSEEVRNPRSLHEHRGRGDL